MSVTAHRGWDGASSTPRRPLAAGFGAVRASQAGGGTSCGVQCCASGMQWMWCSPRAVRFGPRLPKPARSDHGRARSRRTGRPWAAWARVLCAEQQLQLVGARGAAPHSPPRGAPVASCCVRVRARTEGARGARWAWAGVWGGWHRERGAAAQNALQQRSAVTKASAGSGGRKSAATAKIKATARKHRGRVRRGRHTFSCFFLRTRIRDATTARPRRSKSAPPF